MAEKRKKSKYEIKLLDEKRAFVVVALTAKLSLAGKAAAANALAHYDSRVGYAYVSVPRMAGEAGYSASSTKTINKGLEEMQGVGAFKVVRTRGGAKNTHHICPIMAWFRAEYDHLRNSGRIDEDEFADIRGEEDNSGSEREMKSGSEQEKSGSGLENPGSALNNSGSRLDNPGSKPDEEDKEKKTLEVDQEKKTKRRDASASGERGPAGSSDDHGSQSKPANDNSKVEPWPDDVVDKFQSHYPKGGDRSKIVQALEEIRREGRTEYRDILRGASNYRGENVGVEPRYLKSPENFLKGRLWTGYQKDNRPKSRKVAAI